MQRFEASLAAAFTVSGRGLHTNTRARVTVSPAPDGHGIRFAVDGGEPVALSWKNRVPSRLNTALRLPDGGTLRTVEHLAASLSTFGIDNALVHVEGSEIPILDGSARLWCARLADAGTVQQPRLRRYIRITRPFQVASGERFLRAEPCSEMERDVTGEHFFSRDVQAWRGVPTRAVFRDELADSRSSGRVSRAWQRVSERLFPEPGSDRTVGDSGARRAANAPIHNLSTPLAADILAQMPFPPDEPLLRGALPGRVVIWIGPWALGGRRFPDERVRHNTLDFLGDLALAGKPILGRVIANRPTHRLTFAFVAMLMRYPEVWEMWEA